MKKYLLLFSILSVTCQFTNAQTINKDNIEIVRDSFGVPYIFAKTDAEVAYGLAWAHAEDNFKSIQENLLIGKGMLGRIKGTKGVIFDFGLQFFGIDTLVENNYEKDISNDFKKVIEAYTQGINDFAKMFPNEILLKKALPFSPKDMLKTFTLMTTLFAGSGLDLIAIRNNLLKDIYKDIETGSNAIAIQAKKTEDNKTWLLANSHQPIEGTEAWYEANLHSEEGWHISGGLFPGGATIFVGANENLGWAHTTNYHNFGDVYKLQLNQNNKEQYLIDNEYQNFDYKTIKLKVKIGFLKLPVKRKIPISKFGPVFVQKNKENHTKDYYAFRFPGAMNIAAAEQWYRMNKATNFAEFEQAVKMNQIALFNIIYADKEDNIFLISDGRIPLRDTNLNWQKPITANSSAYIWKNLVPYESKVKSLNPDCGFVFNANGTPLNATCLLDKKTYYIGVQKFDFNRNELLGNFLRNYKEEKFTYHFFKEIKYNKEYIKNGSYGKNFSILYQLNEKKYPNISQSIQFIKNWNYEATFQAKESGFALVMHHFITQSNKLPFAFLMIKNTPIEEKLAVNIIEQTQQFMQKKYGTIQKPLHEIQFLARGNKKYPIEGMPEMLRAVYTKYDKKQNIFVMKAGDGFHQFVKFSKENGVEIESISPFGASTRPESPHYNDQMELFVKQQTKKVTLDKAEIYKKAKYIYKVGQNKLYYQ